MGWVFVAWSIIWKVTLSGQFSSQFTRIAFMQALFLVGFQESSTATAMQIQTASLHSEAFIHHLKNMFFQIHSYLKSYFNQRKEYLHLHILQ